MLNISSCKSLVDPKSLLSAHFLLSQTFSPEFFLDKFSHLFLLPFGLFPHSLPISRCISGTPPLTSWTVINALLSFPPPLFFLERRNWLLTFHHLFHRVLFSPLLNLHFLRVKVSPNFRLTFLSPGVCGELGDIFLQSRSSSQGAIAPPFPSCSKSYNSSNRVNLPRDCSLKKNFLFPNLLSPR